MKLLPARSDALAPAFEGPSGGDSKYAMTPGPRWGRIRVAQILTEQEAAKEGFQVRKLRSVFLGDDLAKCLVEGRGVEMARGQSDCRVGHAGEGWINLSFIAGPSHEPGLELGTI